MRREFRVSARTRRAGIFITHDIEEAAVVGDRLAIMVGGEIRQTGKPREVLDAPADRDVAALVQAGNMYDGHIIASPDGPVVEAAVGSLRVAGRGLSAGQRVTAVIRPEGIRVLREDRDISRFADATILQGRDRRDRRSRCVDFGDGGRRQRTYDGDALSDGGFEPATPNRKPIRLAIPPERIHLILRKWPAGLKEAVSWSPQTGGCGGMDGLISVHRGIGEGLFVIYLLAMVVAIIYSRRSEVVPTWLTGSLMDCSGCKSCWASSCSRSMGWRGCPGITRFWG
ncbi:MAG: hypothetical protein R2849_20920 [Thermomicrobiales bacterium]